MPTYDFVCPKCNHRFEKFQPMSAAPLKKCPKCGTEADGNPKFCPECGGKYS